ncbi:MAG: biotin/lipoyl-binding protein, partial [Betaproteobacteria bacterium]|nr:biotin/lipoyl-binding protein [Betaproteobacteria bacterium]
MPAPATRRTARLATTLVIVAVLGAAAFAAWRYLGPADKAPQLRLAKVERGGITSTVSASGTLTAVTTVLVGSQISGQVREILVDFNSPVKKGQLLARIDPETFELKVKQADADLEAARTSLLQRESEAASQRS